MTEAIWLAGKDRRRMLRSVESKSSDRERRLFCVWLFLPASCTPR